MTIIKIENFEEGTSKNGKKFTYVNNKKYSVWDESLQKIIKEGEKELECEVVEKGNFKNLVPLSETKKSRGSKVDLTKIEEALEKLCSILSDFKSSLDQINKK